MEKVVQTTLNEATYTRLAEKAKKEGKPLKTVVREAIEQHLRQELPPWEQDPLSRLVGSGNLPAGNWSERKDWRDPWLKHTDKEAYKRGRVR